MREVHNVVLFFKSAAIFHERGVMKKTITHEIVRASVKEFLKGGGFIKRLPDQKSIRRVMGVRHGTFEFPSDLEGFKLENVGSPRLD